MINLTFCVSNLTQISPAIYKLVLFIQTIDRVPFIRWIILKRKEGKGKKKTVSRQYERRVCEKEIDMHDSN